MAVSNNFWIIIFLISLLAKNSIAARKLNASQAFDETWNTAPDLENELEQKRTKSPSIGPSVSGHWSGWSEWSTCSRSCDGGIMQQIRRCSNQNGCRGESIRYRICNMQPCPDQQDFRAQQCTAFNDVPYDGTLYKWIPHYDYVEPCALTCRGYPAHLSEEIISEAENPGTDSEHYDEQSVVVQLSASVQDGTRCRSGSLDMCIKGKCQRVGCDLKIGSAKKIDSCGVCGGDGSSCSQALYYWDIAPMSPCSVICGGGYKMSQTVCKNRLSGNIVDDSLCNPTTRPEPTVELCNTHICPPAWIADDWSSCSRLCGTGYRERIVICAEENNGVRTRVAEMLCRFPKPPTQESCIIEECPKWDVEEWTPCSASCGPGVQLRSVECKSPDGSLSAKCDPVVKPISARQCSSDGSCNEDKISGGTIILGRSHDMIDHTAMGSDFDEEDEEEDDDEDESNSEISDRSEGVDDESEAMSYNDQAPLYLHQSMNILHQEEPIGPKVQSLTGSKSKMSHSDPVSTEPTFIKDNEFSPCSVTCGEGIRRRSYKCKIFLEYSRTFATVNDSLCEGQKPKDEVERCVEDPCMLPSHGYDDQFPRDSIKVGVSEPGKTYVWREQGYTSCSASCLGGVEELIINCVREDNGRVVSPFLCSPETKPEARVRTCNDRPCPPRWNYSDYTPCSKSCGIGIKTREVQCIHEVTRGGDNTMVVPNSMCPQPPPADRQYCNVLDCPVRWEVGEWSKCSHTCGYGIKERKVECKQIMAQEHKIERPETMCPSVRPPDKKPCNVKPCPPEDPKPIISITNTTHIQHDPRKSKITLKIGGAAVVFFGTQVKIKCPVKRYNRTKIKWSKDHKPLAKSRKFKISKKGALRILDITFRDAGVYSCHADLSSAEIQIEVKAKPGQPIEEQFGGQESERLVRERSGSEPLISADMTALDNVTNYLNGNRKKQQNARERNRRPKSHEVQNAELNLKQNEQTNLLPQGDDRPQASASSGGSRTHALLAMPYFQMLLSNLQKLRASSYGNRMLNDKVYKFEDLLDETKKEKSFLLQQQLLKNQQQLKQQTDFDEKHKILLKMTDSTEMKENSHNDNVNYNNIAQSTTGDTYHLVPHIAKFSPMNVNKNLLKEVPLNHFIYDWRTSEWSKCSQSCETGNRGLRSRNLTCIRKPQVSALPSIGGGPPLAISNKAFLSTETVVNNAYCEEFGLKMPSALEPCDTNECPRWVSEEWSPCQKSRCIGRNVAIQKRKIFCQYENGTESTNCRDYNKPIIRRECYNERCKGVWRVEPWTKCNAPCGRKGIKYRIIQCVWYGTRRPAGNACKNQARPAVMKVCKSESCFSRALNCKDKSRYCPNVYKMGLCRLHQYQEKCCNSCNFNMH